MFVNLLVDARLVRAIEEQFYGRVARTLRSRRSPAGTPPFPAYRAGGAGTINWQRHMKGAGRQP